MDPLTRFFSILLAAVSLFVPPAAADSILVAPVRVFVLAGQSNMLGRGFPLSQGDQGDPRLMSWREDGWQVAADPLGGPADVDNGIGPGMTFGLAILHATPGLTVGLIQCAHGGTTIGDWQPDGKWYQACMEKIHASGATAVVGVLFLQGESDALKKKLASAWASMFSTLAAAFRHDLHARVVLGQIGKPDPVKYAYQQIVRDQQAAAAKKLGIRLVKTIDLAVGPDGVHFTVASYKTIGSRFAAAYQQAAR